MLLLFFLLAPFLLAADTLLSTPAEATARIQSLQETHARETRGQQLTRIKPRRKLEREPSRRELTDAERAQLKAALERFVNRKCEPDQDCR